jgi:hypothetical protein
VKRKLMVEELFELEKQINDKVSFMNTINIF